MPTAPASSGWRSAHGASSSCGQAAQNRAFGQVLVVSSDLQLDITITLAAGAVILYTAAGGMLADAWTDLVQGIVLIAGLVALAVAVIASGGAAALAEMPADRLTLIAPGATLIGTLEQWAPPILGSLVAQELIARALSARSPEVARRSALIASGAYFALGIVPPMLGLIAARTMPGLRDRDRAHAAGLVAAGHAALRAVRPARWCRPSCPRSTRAAGVRIASRPQPGHPADPGLVRSPAPAADRIAVAGSVFWPMAWPWDRAA